MYMPNSPWVTHRLQLRMVGWYATSFYDVFVLRQFFGGIIDIKHVNDYLVNSKQQNNFRYEFLDHQNPGKVLLYYRVPYSK